MEKNNQQIHIHHEFIESDTTTFLSLYDLSLVRFMMQYKSKNFGSITYSTDPKEIDEIEKEFIKTTLYYLKNRKREIRANLNKILHQFLKENKITKEELNNEWDSGLGDKLDKYNRERLPEKEMEEDSSFGMKINFLLIKANKLGCVIDLEEDFKFDETVDYNTDQNLYFSAKGSEKLVFLKETGIIDFLKEENPDVSQNKLAKLLSIITGERHLQPGLNSMENNLKFDRKNPYYSSKTAPMVQDQLTRLGFKIKKTTEIS